jgi:hypothetical protein
MKKLSVLMFSIVVAGCSSFSMPSFYDDNESLIASQVVTSTQLLDCESSNVKDQIVDINNKKEWLKTYSTLKGSKDIVVLIEKLEVSLDPLVKKEEVTPAYCNVKKKTLVNQTSAIAEAIMRRF